ncbi:acyl-CoA dehydrogenase family protein [Micromonospora sp. WMMA1363]|uniref:acyl-CoA dehydrogenase family protein n=1 Tax=Micromonospora sp. WMMA1363 TaxID=3053985 RepID=UPI00259D28F0|nr:acyl-CoA dehydrogenase family protein [Micromonospora sp. WMMA1363]MDM4719387.1 acyl-CoA dehydrogenase family protein [Micromonospora sp. WMMA1363]
MRFTPSEGHRELAALTRQILTDRVTADRRREIEAKGVCLDRPLWRELADAGVLAAALPRQVGGDGLGLLEQCGILVEVGRTVAPVPYLSGIVTAAAGLAAFGDDTQITRWVTPALAGTAVLTAALAEDDGVRAERATGRWVLTGAKTTVPAAPDADLLLVPATVDGTTAVFMVCPDDPGVTVQPQQVAGGEGAGWLDLAGVALPDDRLLGGVADGRAVASWLATRATIGSCAIQLGVTERALELTAEYARTRVQFGRPIGTFQAVAQRLADAYIDVEAIRLTLWQAAWRLAEGLPCPTEVATAKFWAADAGHRVAHTAVHIHGGVGIDLDHHLHRYFLAAKHHEFRLGGATAQLRAIGAALSSADLD